MGLRVGSKIHLPLKRSHDPGRKRGILEVGVCGRRGILEVGVCGGARVVAVYSGRSVE